MRVYMRADALSVFYSIVPQACKNHNRMLHLYALFGNYCAIRIMSIIRSHKIHNCLLE